MFSSPVSTISAATRSISRARNIISPSNVTRSTPQSLSSRCIRQRQFSTSRQQKYAAAGPTRGKSGPFSLRSAALFIGTGLGLVAYFQYEKARLERKRTIEASRGHGVPMVGGAFALQDLEGREYTEKDLLGKYSIIYFGFTHCPDICPDELDKLSAAIDILNGKVPNTFRPLFISVDPARDTPGVLKSYLAEFHPQIMGLTGTWQQIKDTCKVYRVYFSTPQDVDFEKDDSYLVDHSIYFYVMDPEGKFVECIGRQDTPESAAAIVLDHIKDWKKEGKAIDTTPIAYRNNVVQQTAQKRSSEIGGVANKATA